MKNVTESVPWVPSMFPFSMTTLLCCRKERLRERRDVARIDHTHIYRKLAFYHQSTTYTVGANSEIM